MCNFLRTNRPIDLLVYLIVYTCVQLISLSTLINLLNWIKVYRSGFIMKLNRNLQSKIVIKFWKTRNIYGRRTISGVVHSVRDHQHFEIRRYTFTIINILNEPTWLVRRGLVFNPFSNVERSVWIRGSLNPPSPPPSDHWLIPYSRSVCPFLRDLWDQMNYSK